MFEETDYRQVITTYIKKAGKIKGYKLSMASAMGCHSSFLSQVLNGSTHLTPDHAAGLSDFWGLTDDQTKYFINLVNIARSGNRKYRRFLEAEQEEIRARQKEVSSRISSKRKVSDSGPPVAWYYSSWLHTAIHIALSVKSLRTVTALSHRLGIPIETIQKTIEKLDRYGFIERDSDGWKTTIYDLHINAASPLIGQHHSNWRQYCLTRLGMRSSDETTHYTSVMTLSRKDWEKIREMGLKFLAESRETAIASPEEELFCLNLDMFRV